MSNSKKSLDDPTQSENCFSKDNFKIVYNYIVSKAENSNNTFYEFCSYEIYAESKIRIVFKKNNFTIAVIDQDKGIYSLAKGYDNSKIVKEINVIFCDLFSVVENK